MAKRILSVSYDQALLKTRGLLLEQQGHQVVSALGFTDALAQCRSDGYDLFVLGHSIPHNDKNELVRVFRQNCPAPILSLTRWGELPVDGADHLILPDDPAELVAMVAEILKGRSTSTR